MKKSHKKRNIIIAIVIIFFIAGISEMGNDSNQSDPATSPQALTQNEASSDNKEQQKNTDTEEPTSQPTQEPTPEPTPEIATYSAGTYKIGTDMPAGEYVLFVDGFSGYFSINKNSDGDLDNIIANDNFITNTIITVKKGQYLQLNGAYAVPIKQAKELDTTKEGMFKVGTHLKAGEYKIEVDKNSTAGYGYVEVSTDSTHTLDSVKTNDNFQGTKYITVKKGQYLKLSGAHIVSK